MSTPATEPRERSSILRALIAWPTLYKVSFAEAVAYRTEFLIWILTTTMPFIMMALMISVAREAPVTSAGGETWGVADFTAYYLATLLVRLCTGAWVVWEMTQEIRMGTMTLRLLRPIHPFVTYASDNLAALPLRGILGIPLVISMLIFAGDGLAHDPVMWLLAAIAIAGAWLLNFLIMCAIGCLAFFAESAVSIFEVWLGLFFLFSGYLIPLDLFPEWVVRATSWLPFRLMVDLPVRMLLGRITAVEALTGIALQGAWIFGVGVLVHFLWRAGLRRYQAFGG